MAIVTSSFNAAGLQAASEAFLTTGNLENAISWGVAAYNNSLNVALATTTSLTSDFISGTLTNGDKISMWGSNLTSIRATYTHVDYTFVSAGITASLYGSIFAASPTGSETGYIDKVIIASAGIGSITINGYDDVAILAPASITSVSVDYKGAQFTLAGALTATTSIVGNYYQTAITGNYTSGAIAYAGQTMQLAQISLAASAGVSSLDTFFSSVLSGNDNISGSSGNDLLGGFAGNDAINGGAGTDTAIFFGTRSNFTISKSDVGYTVIPTLGTEGTDALSNVERMQFNDISIAFDIHGTAGQAYRLYQAAFDRTPDLGGLGFWIKTMDTGYSLSSVASGFVQSAEFQTLYGISPSNTTLITKFYQNVLHRAPDQEGLDFWVNHLNLGNISPAVALANFSESPENQALVIGAIQNGIEFTA